MESENLSKQQMIDLLQDQQSRLKEELETTQTATATNSVSKDTLDFFDKEHAPSSTQSVQQSPNKNQTIVGKKELNRLRKKAEQFTTLLNKAKALKEKNKEIKDEMAEMEEMKE